MVNFGPLAAEIVSLVWGTPANFNGFRALAALLHGTLVVDISQTLRRWTEGATYIRQAAITLGIGTQGVSENNIEFWMSLADDLNNNNANNDIITVHLKATSHKNC